MLTMPIIALIITNLFLLSIAIYLKLILNKRDNVILVRDEDIIRLKEENMEQRIKIAELSVILDQEQQNRESTKELFSSLQTDLTNRFLAVSSEVISRSNNDFLTIANSAFDNKEKAVSTVVSSIKEALLRLDSKINETERSRSGAYEALATQLKSLSDSQTALRESTVELTGALRSPNIRGHWGETQLRRLLEMSGMIPHVDFVEQACLELDDGRVLKPDVIINIPNGRKIIVDVKTPMLEYTKALEEKDEKVRSKLLSDFIKRIKDHINTLSKKQYQERCTMAPDFVIMFMPSESLFATALSQDPSIIEDAAVKRVVLATPSTLLSMLNIIAMVWRHDNVSKSIDSIIADGKEICANLADVEACLEKIGRSIQQASSAYHDSMSLLERKVFQSSKKFLNSVNSVVSEREEDDAAAISVELDMPEAVCQ